MSRRLAPQGRPHLVVDDPPREVPQEGDPVKVTYPWPDKANGYLAAMGYREPQPTWPKDGIYMGTIRSVKFDHFENKTIPINRVVVKFKGESYLRVFDVDRVTFE